MGVGTTAAIVGGVGALASGAIAADGSKKAGKEAAKGAQAAAGVSERQFDIANNLTANQRNIGNQALNALGARYGFTPAAGFGADFDPFDLEPGKTVKGVGKGKISGADLRELLKQGLTIDQVLEIGTLKDDANLSKVNGFRIPATEIQRLRSGTFSPEYMAANAKPVSSGTGIPDQFNPTPIPLPPPAGGLQTGQPQQGMVPAEDFIDTTRLRELAGPVDTSLAAFEASPDYQFRLGEGLNAVQNSAAARGGLYSGNALRGITDFASNLASGEYNDFFNRRQVDRTNDVNRELTQLQLRRNFSDGDFNRLGSLAGIGTTATQNLNALGAQTSSNIGNALIDAGNARASGIAGQTNALLGGIGDLSTVGLLAGGGFFNRGNQRASGVNQINALAGGFDTFTGLPRNQRFS